MSLVLYKHIPLKDFVSPFQQLLVASILLTLTVYSHCMEQGQGPGPGPGQGTGMGWIIHTSTARGGRNII